MDIYQYAKDIDYGADYYDSYTGMIYKIQDYGKCLKNGLPTRGIEVIDADGKSVGYAIKNKEKY